MTFLIGFTIFITLLCGAWIIDSSIEKRREKQRFLRHLDKVLRPPEERP